MIDIISIHALREEGDETRLYMGGAALHFYPRPPRGGRRAASRSSSLTSIHFYPRPPRGGRRLPTTFPHLDLRISIHALREEGDQRFPRARVRERFLSTPSARRATRHRAPCSGILPISIHALREEGDARSHRSGHLLGGISIHALREEGDFSSATA